MTVWDAYLLLLRRLGFGSRSPELLDGEEADSADLPAIQWLPSFSKEGAGVEINLWQWLGIPLALLFALAGQLALTGGMEWVGFAALIVGTGLFIFEVWRLGLDWRQSREATVTTAEVLPLPGLEPQVEVMPIRWQFIILAYIFTGITFMLSGNNNFTVFARVSWVASLVMWICTFWEGPSPFNAERVRTWLLDFPPQRFALNVTLTGVLLLLVLGISAWFRFQQLDEVPIAMTSDHVEKLIDVNDILNNGKRPIFEPSNGGREPLEFYFAAFTAWAAGTGLSYLTLKIVTSTAGFLTLPFIFLLAREISQDDTVALLTTLAAGIGWWPNVISRNGLRFPFAMLFAAITLWLIVRALRRDKQNSMLFAAVALGVGLYGYTPIRIVPVAVGVAFGLYAIHRWSRFATLKMVTWFAIFVMIVLTAFMPMVRYAVDEPENFWRRTFTRMTGEPGLETAQLDWRHLSCDEDKSAPPPANGLEQTALTGWVFLCNESNSLRMFNWTSDSAWLISPANQPALDWVMGALFFVGVGICLYRYIRYREWLDLFLLLAIPVLLLPSTLALAFPIENPSLHRSGAAIPVVFIFVAITLRVFLAYGRKAFGDGLGRAVGVGVVTLLFLISAQENWNILFVRYANQYKSSVQNSPELGEEVRAWADSVGDLDTVVVKAYPYWVDTRAVGYYAGAPGWNNVALEVDQLDDLVNDPRPKLYILHEKDADAIAFLRKTYPSGTLTFHPSQYLDKNFLTFFVPGTLDFDEKLLQTP